MFSGGFSSEAASKTENPIFIQTSNSGRMSDAEIRAMKEFTEELRQTRKEGLRGNWYLRDLEKIQDSKSNIVSNTKL